MPGIQLTKANRELGHSDQSVRDQLARVAYEVTYRTALSMTRDNRLWEKEDVLQQVWIFAYEAVEKDKGIGDARPFYRFHILNRIRDWMGSTVRQHAFCSCTKCGHRQAVEAAARRICNNCGATGSDIESVTVVDRKADYIDVHAVRDDLSTVTVQDFWRSLDPLQQAVLTDRLNGRERVEIAVRQQIPMSRVSKVVTSLQESYREQYA